MTRIEVDLPAPLGPRKPVTRPGRAVNETSSTAVKAPYVLVSDSTVIMRRLCRRRVGHHIGDDAGRTPDATLSGSGSSVSACWG